MNAAIENRPGSFCERYGSRIILLFYIAGLIIFLPIIRYPYGDSWMYSRNVYDAFSSGNLQFLEVQAALPIFQVTVGALLCKLTGGFGFWKLNLLTYLFSYFAVLITFKFTGRMTRNYSAALLCSLILIGMPPFFKTSLSFMTDIYFYFGLIFGLYYGFGYLDDCRNDKGGSVNAFLFSAGFVIAILSRTNGFLTYLAFLLCVIFSPARKKTGLKLWLILALPLIITGIFQAWVTINNLTPYQAMIVQKTFLKELVIAFTSAEFFPFIWTKIVLLCKWAGYVGVLLLPVSLYVMSRTGKLWKGGEAGKIEKKVAIKVWFILVPAVIFLALVLSSLSPETILLPNTITPYGMGVKNVILPGAERILSPDFFQILKTILTVGGILLGLACIGRVMEGGATINHGKYLLWVFIATALFPILTGIFSDRYLIPLIPLLFVLFFGADNTRLRIPVWVWIIALLLIAFSGLLANEYFGWNNAKWELVYRAVREEVIELDGTTDPERRGILIDGGLEFTGFRYFSNEEYLKAIKENPGNEKLPEKIPAAYALLPDYAFWWALPREYDYMVRIPEYAAQYQDGLFGIRLTPETEIEYRPFPWFEKEILIIYSVDANWEAD